MENLGSRLTNPTLGTFDYYMFRLHDLPANIRKAHAKAFLGWRAQEDLSLALNPRSAVLPAWDKFTFHLFANSFGIPAPPVLASFRPNTTEAWHSAGVLLRTRQELADWLRQAKSWPMFAKPSYSQQSIGCFYLERFSAATDALVLANGQSLPVDHFIDNIVLAPSGEFFQRDMGYLFQEVLRPHERIAELVGNQAISSIRVIVAQDDSGPSAIAAVWKIARGKNISDTRADDELGHLHAPVDLANGRVGAALNGYELAAYPTNPDTGLAIEGFMLPYWAESMDACLRAASMFPMMRIQHWDLAITDTGPRLLEVNDIGAIEFLQKFGKGLLTPRLREILLRHGNPKRFPWIAKLCSPGTGQS